MSPTSTTAPTLALSRANASRNGRRRPRQQGWTQRSIPPTTTTRRPFVRATPTTKGTIVVGNAEDMLAEEDSSILATATMGGITSITGGIIINVEGKTTTIDVVRPAIAIIITIEPGTTKMGGIAPIITIILTDAVTIIKQTTILQKMVAMSTTLKAGDVLMNAPTREAGA